MRLCEEILSQEGNRGTDGPVFGRYECPPMWITCGRRGKAHPQASGVVAYHPPTTEKTSAVPLAPVRALSLNVGFNA